jgi:spore cortex formation protein SpoVR/YcgB (stage V sporulation)
MAVWSSDALDRHRDILQIIREESYYFHPQFKTKIINEGWASYWHAKLFYLYDDVSPEEMIEFARLHAGVVNSGGRYSIKLAPCGRTRALGQRTPSSHRCILDTQ